jgi:hypothetical protein
MQHHNQAKSVLKAFLKKRSNSFPQQFNHDLPDNQAANTSEKGIFVLSNENKKGCILLQAAYKDNHYPAKNPPSDQMESYC